MKDGIDSSPRESRLQINYKRNCSRVLTPLELAELVLLREDDRGAGRVGGGAGAGAGPGGGHPGGGARRAAAAQHEHQHPAHTQVPHWADQGVRQQIACLRARQGRCRGARQGARGAWRRRAAVRLRRAHSAPRRALPHARRTLPGVPYSDKVWQFTASWSALYSQV